jgi:hypothetical protein
MPQAVSTVYPHMKQKPTTIREIEEIIKSLKVKDSHRYDEVSTVIQKISSPIYNFTFKLHM